MLKPRFLCFIATAVILCLILFTACQEPANNDTDPDNTAGTWVEFKNLEQFPVTIYSDPARQVVFAEVTANGTKKVVAVPNSAGTAFYPTFKLDLFDIPGISVPYNGPVIITGINADKINTVPIPKLTSIETNSAYIKLTNNSNSSLTLRQGNAEKSPLGGGSTIISAGQSAAYEITPGPVSGYSIMHNTTTPVAFPSGLTEFEASKVYELNYNGTTLTLSWQDSVVFRTAVIVTGSGLANKLYWLKDIATSNSLYRIKIDKDESIPPQTLYYSGKSGITIILNGIGRTVTCSDFGSLFTIGSGVTLILDNITLNTASYLTKYYSLVHINSGGTLVMNTGTNITDNKPLDIINRKESCGGVYVGGTFIMNGGRIYGVTSYRGGGVLVDGGTFIMNGGEISRNTAGGDAGYICDGGGVYVWGGTFTMNGGEISGNTATGSGGGVYVSSGTFTMNGGEISRNTATNSGGGVYVSGGPFTMSGGVIYGNNAAAGLKNTATNGAVLYKYSSSIIAQYGTFSGDTFYKSGDLSTTETTIRIVNGNLLTE
jgi:hypothetical protein